MTQHYFAVFFDSETHQLVLDPEVSINFDWGNIWNPVTEEWLSVAYDPATYSDETDEMKVIINNEEFAIGVIQQALERWNEGE